MGKKVGIGALIGGATALAAGGSAAAYVFFAKRVGKAGDLARKGRETGSKWHAIVVHKPRKEIVSAGPPAPLAALGNAVGYRVESVGNGTATKIAVRIREGETINSPDNKDPEEVLEAALKEAKHNLEKR